MDGELYNNEDKIVFYYNIKAKTKLVKEMSSEEERREAAYYFELTEISRKLAAVIVKEAIWEINKAAVTGLNSVECYRYGDGAYFMGKPVAFLINGPKNEGLDHFKSRNIVDVVTLVRNELPKFEIKTKSRGKGTNTYNYIEISW